MLTPLRRRARALQRAPRELGQLGGPVLPGGLGDPEQLPEDKVSGSTPPPPPRTGKRGRPVLGAAGALLRRLELYRDDVLRFATDFRVSCETNRAERNVRDEGSASGRERPLSYA
jgi:hypothetical protein